jgi:hypothetical protein
MTAKIFAGGDFLHISFDRDGVEPLEWIPSFAVDAQIRIGIAIGEVPVAQ